MLRATYQEEFMNYARVYTVDKVDCALLKSNPPALAIRADGWVNSSGWSNAHLSEWVYITPPGDGILDLDFIAKKPEGFVIWVVTPVHADLILRPVDMANFWGPGLPLKGVRVHSATNDLQHTCIDAARAAATGRFAMVVPGDRWPW